MFLSNRFIAAGLLVFYGIPMAIGPSWHRHDQNCDASACHLTGVEGALPEDTHTAHNHDHEHVHGKLVGQEIDATPDTHEQAQAGSGSPHAPASKLDAASGSLQSLDTHASCAVCAFYSQSQLASRLSERPTDEALLHSVATTYLSVGRTAYSECQPRGPPARSYL